MAGFVFIKQHDAMQCGAACLVMLCHFYGKKYSLQQISKSLESSKGGVSMYDISELAKKIGLKCNGKIVSLDILKTYKNPCILHWDQNHFVILCKYKKRGVVVADPGKGKSGKTKCDALIKRNVIFSSKTKCNKIKTHSTKEVDLKPIIKSTFSLYIKFKLHILISVK